MHKLNDRQKAFCREYVIDLNATQAATRAGYSAKTAYSIGNRLLKKVEIQGRIAELQADSVKRTQIDADYVLSRLQTVVERCLQEEEVIIRVDGEEQGTGEYKFEHAGANRALELLGRHLSLFNDKLNVNHAFDPTKLSDDELRDIANGK